LTFLEIVTTKELDIEAQSLAFSFLQGLQAWGISVKYACMLEVALLCVNLV